MLNNPYPASQWQQDIYYSTFSEQPKTLDPAKSYSSNEYIFTNEIYEPLLKYDYFIRPYTLVPQTASRMPEIVFLNQQGQIIDQNHGQEIAYTRYRISIQPGIYYQPHPAFAKNKQGRPFYFAITEAFLDKEDIYTLSDFKETATRELVAADYIYQIKRMADPANSSAIAGLMSEYIVGFKTFAEQLPPASQRALFTDLRSYSLEGVKETATYNFEITLKGHYAQFVYWLAMPFFSPVPWEVERFYKQPGMEDRNLNLDSYPVGTGPFMMSENNPNKEIVLDKNPNYRPVYFPDNGNDEDRANGYMQSFGKRLPMIKRAIYVLEKETIPRWNKFLQGYYDLSGISADSYDQAIRVGKDGQARLSPELKNKQMRLSQTDEPTIFYLGFNMMDSVVGGRSQRARLLRQAISIAVNYDEYIAIFLNGRGRPSQGPIPPGIFGYKEGETGVNPYVYDWKDGHLQRKDLEKANILMQQAGYPAGKDPETGRALVLHYDVMSSGSPDDKAQLDWMRKQFAKLGIALNIRSTQYNRFQEKMRMGNAQIFSWGWKADYPDPENFLFLLYGPNAKVAHGGENAANYHNQQFDRLFEAMRNRDNDSTRQEIIDRMTEIVRFDAPWIFGVNAQTFTLSQQWMSAIKPNTIAPGALEYIEIDVTLRNELRLSWNRPLLWPLGLFIGFACLLLLPMWITYRRKEQQSVRRFVQ